MRSAAVFTLSSLSANARAKANANPRSVLISDLSPDQQALAANRNHVAIINGNSTTFLSPTGNFVEAFFAVKSERESQGI